MPAVSERARNLVGQEIDWTDNKGVTRHGTVVAVEPTFSVICDTETGESWPGVKFRIKCGDGRTRWTVAFADKATP